MGARVIAYAQGSQASGGAYDPIVLTLAEAPLDGSMLVYVHVANRAVDVPTGWTEVLAYPWSGNVFQVLAKVASGEGASHAFTPSATYLSATGTLLVIDGHDGTLGMAVSQAMDATSDGALTCPDEPCAVDDLILVAVNSGGTAPTGFSMESAHSGAGNELSLASKTATGSTTGTNDVTGVATWQGNRAVLTLVVGSAVFDPAALLTDLVGDWPLDEATGATRADLHGSFDLTDVGGAVAQEPTAKLGAGAHFSGAGGADYLKHATDPDLETGDVDFTVEVWVNFDSLADYAVVLAKDDLTDREFDLLYHHDLGQLAFLVFTSSGQEVVYGGAPSMGTWYHLLAWHRADTGRLYLQVSGGTVQSTLLVGTPLSAGSAPFTVGQREGAYANSPLDGVVDQVRFWRRVLTDAERTWLFHAGAGRAYADLAGAPPPGDLTGNAAGAATTGGTLTGAGALAGGAAGTSMGVGALAGRGTMAGTASGVTSTAAHATGLGALGGVGSGAASVTATCTGVGALTGTAAGHGTAAGSFTLGAIAGAAHGLGECLAVLTGRGALAGASVGVGTAVGVASGGPPPTAPSPSQGERVLRIWHEERRAVLVVGRTRFARRA